MDIKYSREDTLESNAEHEKRLQMEVEAGLNEAKSPRTRWIPHEVMLKKMDQERRRLKRLIVSRARARANGADLDTAGQQGLGAGDSECEEGERCDSDKSAASL